MLKGVQGCFFFRFNAQWVVFCFSVLMPKEVQEYLFFEFNGQGRSFFFEFQQIGYLSLFKSHIALSLFSQQPNRQKGRHITCTAHPEKKKRQKFASLDYFIGTYFTLRRKKTNKREKLNNLKTRIEFQKKNRNK